MVKHLRLRGGALNMDDFLGFIRDYISKHAKHEFSLRSPIGERMVYHFKFGRSVNQFGPLD